MNALTKPQAGKVPAAIIVPQPSLRLARVMTQADKHLRPGPTRKRDDWFSDEMPPPELVAEAKALTTALAPLLAPAAPSLIQAWLMRLAAGVANPPSVEDFPDRAAAICAACSNLPVAVFTMETLGDALRRWRFWPSASEIFELLEPLAGQWDDRHWHAARIANVRPIAELDEACRQHTERMRQTDRGEFPSDVRRRLA